MALKFYNTLSRQVEEFKTIENKKVKLYTCGPTVYNFVHIGNLRTFLFEDLLVRYLRYLNFEVIHVMNLTDVDDKTIKGSQKEKKSLNDYTKIYKKSFFDDIETLNISKAQFYPAATETIPEMIEMIDGLIKKGFAYIADDKSVYFSITKFKEYGRLFGIKHEELKDGASGRISSDEYTKEEAKDFVLWKAWDSDDGDVFWDSPFGKGRPGWHIECSAMSIKYLGKNFDIHCGGIDNIFPHHENEIAQSEAYSGVKFVNYWMHSAFLNINAEKMAKSKGNFYTLRDLTQKQISPMAIRYALISTHYRQPLNFSDDLLKQSESTLKRVKEFVNNLSQLQKECESKEYEDLIQKTREEFQRHMNDDLNISPALGIFFEFIRKSNSLSETLGKKDGQKAVAFVKEINQVLGCFEFKEAILEEDILKLIQERQESRKNKDFKKSDEIRDYLLAKGVILKDTKEGVKWEKK